MWFRQWWAISKVHHSRIKRKTTADKTIPLHHRKKYFSSNNTQNRKKLEKRNHPYRGDRKKISWNNIKAKKKIHNIDIKAYPHERLNTSKGVIRNGELSLCSITEIKNELKKQNVIDVKRITIKKQNEIIETNTYVLTFNNPKPPLEMKIGYTVVKVETYIPNPRRCHNCQKYGHLKEHCTRKQVCVKCGEQEPNHIEESCKNS